MDVSLEELMNVVYDKRSSKQVEGPWINRSDDRSLDKIVDVTLLRPK
jgi:hypothetical protein